MAKIAEGPAFKNRTEDWTHEEPYTIVVSQGAMEYDSHLRLIDTARSVGGETSTPPDRQNEVTITNGKIEYRSSALRFFLGPNDQGRSMPPGVVESITDKNGQLLWSSLAK